MGLEILVRPLVVPASTPTPLAPLPPSDQAPTSIDGGAGRLIDLHHSRSSSFSHTLEHEVKRKYDVIRIHNPNNDAQYVDDEVVTELTTKDQNGQMRRLKLQKAAKADNIEVLSTDNVRTAST